MLTFRKFLILTLFAAPLLAQAWAGRGRLQGTVHDHEGKPVAEAKVSLLLDGAEGQGPAPVMTNKKGHWSILGLATGTWHITIEKEGFKISQGTSRVISESVGPGTHIPVTLNPIPKELTEAQGPSPIAALERGNVLLTEKKFAAARAEYEAALGLIEDPASHPPILRAIAGAYWEEGQQETALAKLREALAIAPEDQDTLKLLVTLLTAQGQVAEARELQARIVGEFTVDPNSLLNLGIAKYNEGDIEGAADFFEQVVAENPQLPDGYYYRGLIYLNQGKNAEAKADFEKLLEIAPDHPRAADAREFLAQL
jgi:tetratricopeptide (TPR) repeat protein